MMSIPVFGVRTLAERILADHGGWDGMSGSLQRILKDNRINLQERYPEHFDKDCPTLGASYVWSQTSIFTIGEECRKPRYKGHRIFIDVLVIPQLEVSADSTLVNTLLVFGRTDMILFLSRPTLSRAWCLAEIAVNRDYGRIIFVHGSTDLETQADFFQKMEASVVTDLAFLKKFLLNIFGTPEELDRIILDTVKSAVQDPESLTVATGVAGMTVSAAPAKGSDGELGLEVERFGMGAVAETVLAALRSLGVEAVEDLKDLDEADAGGLGRLPLVHQRRLARLIGHHKAKAELDRKYDEAVKLVGKDEAAALRLFQQAAEGGHGDAQNYMGNFHALGRLCLIFDLLLDCRDVRDHEGAVKWFRLSAEQGNAGGQFNIGMMLSCIVEDEEGVKWARLSAEQGNGWGQALLGCMHLEGQGVEKDVGEGAKWVRMSVEQGNAMGQLMFGFMYMGGQGVEQDEGEAVKWFRMSAEQGYAPSQYQLGNLYEDGKGVAKDMSAAREWFKKAAAQDYTEAKSALERIDE